MPPSSGAAGRRGIPVGRGPKRPAPRGLRRALAVVAAATLCAVSVTAGGTSYARDPFQLSRQPCFGAASRDPEHRCRNPQLTFTVAPTPGHALITPSPPCAEVEHLGQLYVCRFGASVSTATATVALVGDSHAFHWKPAVEVAGQAAGWQGASITRTGCPFSRAAALLPGPLGRQCVDWNRMVVHWFVVHPEFGTVFVSEHAGGDVVRHGGSPLATQIAGYIAAWNSLPASVVQIIVIRDTPLAHFDTLACVQRAMTRHLQAGRACAISRRDSRVLRPDPAALAADQLGSSRVQTVDLTHFFCDPGYCYPVVGGALVYRDIGHMTDAFGASLGPFLLRAVRRLGPDEPPPSSAP